MSSQLLNISLTFYIGLTVLLQLISISSCQSSISSDDCTTPIGQRGQCINIRQCPSVISILMNASLPLTQSTKKEVAALGCGFDGKDPKVCCINSEPEPAHEAYQDPPAVEGHPNLKLLPADCGVVYEVRVVGGNKPKIFEFPWMARIAYNTSIGTQLMCGGTIINERYILTAAHCIKDSTSHFLTGVRVGEHDASQKVDCHGKVCFPAYQDIAVEEAITHPDYVQLWKGQRNTGHNDIALLRLASPIDLPHVNVGPVCLPHLKTHREKQLNNTELWISGWGKTDEARESETLVSEKIPYVPNDQCAQLYEKYMNNIIFRQLCAGGLDGGDPCSGDGGGPLQAIENTDGQLRYVQYGIISYGPSPCGTKGFPSVYTRVSYYVKWILDTIRP